MLASYGYAPGSLLPADVEADMAARNAWRGRPLDENLAAAEGGDKTAQTTMGYRAEGESAVAWWRKAAEQGHGIAQTVLGAMLMSGTTGSVPKDAEAGEALLRLAIAQGEPSAMWTLGRFVESTAEEAFSALAPRSQRGRVEGGGHGSESPHATAALRASIVEAAQWYARAAAHGYTRGIKAVQRLQPLVDAPDDRAFGLALVVSLNARACAEATKLSASEAERIAAAPPPTLHIKWSASCCDNVFCTTAPPFSSLSCQRCGDARFCSQPCQKAAWREASVSQLQPHVPNKAFSALKGAVELLEAPFVDDEATLLEGHKAFCGKLAPAPRPLRLVHRGVLHAGLMALGHLLDPAGYTSAGSLKLTKKLACSDAFFGSATDGRSERATPADVRKLTALLKRAASAQRLFLVIEPPCAAPLIDAKHPSRAPLRTMFEFDLEDGIPTAEALIESTRDALAYMYTEEDRLAPGGARYAPGAACTVGMLLPPYMASKLGATLDADGHVTAFHDATRVVYLPPRVRWGTNGPFRIGEMCLEDSILAELRFSKFRVLPSSRLGLGHANSWCVTAIFDA